ncbi:MAG: hypothetical protein LC104_00880 [Bacteroidales bacterium]|nr:hypothetical protein [Bacteroidales bacterium]
MDTIPTRRQLLRTTAMRATAIAGIAGWLATVGRGQDRASRASPHDWLTSDAQAVIDNGLRYLGHEAQGRDGSYSDSRSGFGNVAITGLAGLALMSGGHQPGRGAYGQAVARAAHWIAERGERSSPIGYLNNADALLSHGGMYQHGFGALFLAEVHGMLHDPAAAARIRDVLAKAVTMTRNSQNREGGWRYEPVPNQADVSVTVAQLMALRAARNAGLYIPKSTVDKCVEYIKACQRSDGGFCYIKGQGFAGSAFARSAAAVVGLFSAGEYEGREIERGLKYLMNFLPGDRHPIRDVRPEHYYYGQYYAALAMWTAGGNYWSTWFPAIRDELLARARTTPRGIWSDYHGSAYATAMACIILQLPNNYLPIMQK